MKPDDIGRLIHHRLQQAKDALMDAQCLFNAHGSTTGVVNRAYYGMFYAVQALLQKSGHVPNKHSGTIALFDLEFIKKGAYSKAMSQELHRAFELRQVSDYQAMVTISRKEAEEILAKATAFVHTISQSINTPPDPGSRSDNGIQVRESPGRYRTGRRRKRA